LATVIVPGEIGFIETSCFLNSGQGLYPKSEIGYQARAHVSAEPAAAQRLPAGESG
jgi:hypothetical protein